MSERLPLMIWLPVPDALEYTVSGDNDSGFIVTVALS